ncbi:hydroxymethylglutaryl-CoA reductase, degradative [Myxococcus sp. CA051A]|uniref:3-hydroxy-3-methylglutaryl coenzyme A reductase n=1 Tax=Myxococcus llanfairpwllgwyngyllgogerychwyrndrobwllllantysiliogogogochensis TaxID=2590453 RepID=A0A540WYI8_9BACT|nr:MULTISPECIES: hydroxymethylglutaryl-CoA reductase, degradative [Myxococcus]NTX01303.1 hydroxymethylglutaryl-CoA reductase, degradative [Myxococcus sp. CA040A]NTX15671.1 hydroxymethylglutaryl-CoA reductase, degradative [Myxococcus sp. CA056]NTX33006.1 hydroxymethylglutaryl-CoA reductase, degradative [Myxococcus sp. CA033]NTX53445.1 hydroxymethylglutaryl-CoA reductase, degradative [Myxococcus sp. CA039A]NTX59930.1 hydroxymethylglutaryl-CoA reductase, degradative [Myxococcus sp. CA051A]
MSETVTSRLSGFHKLPMDERLAQLARMLRLSPADLEQLRGTEALQPVLANQMIENAVGTFSLPLGLGLNLQVNGRDYLVPMAVEEPSVVAAVSFAAKIVREAGGFIAEADESMMIGQVQVTRYGDPTEATQKILAHKEQLLALANSFHPAMVARGGGAKDVEVRVLPAPEGPRGEPLLVVHILIDTQEAMGANLINTVAEGVAPLVEQITGGKVYLRILSNLADRRLARATCRIPLAMLADFEMPGETIAEGIAQASRFAEADPYRAATHNKGVMNGIDSVAIATGQDWRAIEAGAHAFACRGGQYRPLSTWYLEEGHLVGRIELPMALGLVGGPIKVHPGVQMALKLLRASSVRELSMVFAAVGLAQNFAALRALGSIGIQKGHMALHARCVAVTAGARGDWVEKLADLLVKAGHVKVEKAREILASLSAEDAAAATGTTL